MATYSNNVEQEKISLINTTTAFYNEREKDIFIEKMNRMELYQDSFSGYENDRDKVIKSLVDKKKITTIYNDLELKKVLYKSQRRYDDLLKKCAYNREIKDFLNGNYAQAGENLTYLMNENNKYENRYLYGYNFNHTLSPLYMNRETKKNLAKVSKIMNLYYEKYSNINNLYFCTLTMPNIPCDCDKIDEHNEMLKQANNTINNLNKKIAKNYKVNGFIKKFECTFKTKKGKNEAHPHYHLLIAFSNDDSIRIMKDSKTKKALANEIFEYWFNNFIKKYFKAKDTVKSIHEEISQLDITDEEKQEKQFIRDCRAGYDFRKCKSDKLELELAGYVAKTTKNHNNQFDYLKNQEIFDYAYLLFYRKRILTYVGCFKEINKTVKEEEIDIDLINSEEQGKYTHKVFFSYNRKSKEYEITAIKEIDCEDDFYDDYMNNIRKKNTE